MPVRATRKQSQLAQILFLLAPGKRATVSVIACILYMQKLLYKHTNYIMMPIRKKFELMLCLACQHVF